MDNENKELLGLNLGHDDFINALVNKNPGPGQVINAHRVFAAIYAMADEEPKAAKMALDKIFGADSADGRARESHDQEREFLDGPRGRRIGTQG